MTMLLRKKGIALAIAAAGCACAAAAQATILIPGTGPLAVDILGAAPGGAVLATNSGALVTPHWSGTFRTAVVDGPEAGVNLDFYYQVTNSPGSVDSLGRVTGADFGAPFSTSVFQTAGAFGIFTAGTQAATSADRGLLGTVGFAFLPGTGGTGKIDPGETSYTLIVRTDATAYGPGVMGVLNGGGTFAAAFQPAIPEPGTMALLASGLLAFGGLARRRAG